MPIWWPNNTTNHLFGLMRGSILGNHCSLAPSADEDEGSIPDDGVPGELVKERVRTVDTDEDKDGVHVEDEDTLDELVRVGEPMPWAVIAGICLPAPGALTLDWDVARLENSIELGCADVTASGPPKAVPVMNVLAQGAACAGVFTSSGQHAEPITLERNQMAALHLSAPVKVSPITSTTALLTIRLSNPSPIQHKHSRERSGDNRVLSDGLRPQVEYGSTINYYRDKLFQDSNNFGRHSPPPRAGDTDYPPFTFPEEDTGSVPQGEDGDEETMSPSGASDVRRVTGRDPTGSGDRERLTTWAANNPHLPLGHIKQRRQLTDAEKGTMKARRTNLHVNKDLMEKDIKEMLARHQTDIEDLAAKHGRKPDYIKKIVTNQTCYKTTRNISLHNAVIHHKGVEINAGRLLGERVPLNEIQKLAKTDPKLQNLSEEKKQELLDALEEHRKVNVTGIFPLQEVRDNMYK
ncbi:hypothetical protein F5887DRAFT_1202893 [Amanita rubescens]|nr:hypothetical protein F5887DRAFT_1202893 [Amanita rubescens]